MLHSLIGAYFDRVRHAVKSTGSCDVERYRELAVGDERALLSIRIRFHSGFLLEINEALQAERVGRMW